MYHASMALAPHDVRVSGGLNIVALVAGGAHGWRLKLCAPSRQCLADIFGCTLDVRSIFSESWACLISLHHNIVGKFLSPMLMPAMKWFLKVWIARSTAFARWLFGSTSCMLIPSLRK